MPLQIAHAALRALQSAIAAVALVCLLATPVAAQSLSGEPTETATATTAVEPDPFGRETPRGAIQGLLDALGSDEFERAANYFYVIEAEPIDLLPEDEGAVAEIASPGSDGADQEAAAITRADLVARGGTLARNLKLALDKGGTLLPYAALSNAPSGKLSDSLEPSAELVGSLGNGEAKVDLTLQRIQPATGPQIWRVSPETIEAIENFVEKEPPAAQGDAEEVALAGAPVFDWLQLLGIALAAFAVFRLISGAILGLLRRFLTDPEASAIYRLLYAGLPPLALYLAVLTFYLTADSLAVSIVARQTMLRYAGIVAWVALAWFALRLVDGVAKFFAARMRRAERRQAVSVITFMRRGAKLFVIAVAAVAVLDTVGLDVTTGIAALGIGGLALALGAQKTIENLVGSISVIADKPVQVGDVAKIGEVFGTVEDIGMRSTRVRTNERTVVTIPNGDLASQRIENYALRDRFLFHQTLGVSYDTTADQMETVLEALREIIGAADNIIDDDARVRFHGFGYSSLDIEIFCYFRTRTYPSALAMQEELLFAIMRKLSELNVEIAFPTRTINLRADTTPT